MALNRYHGFSQVQAAFHRCYFPPLTVYTVWDIFVLKLTIRLTCLQFNYMVYIVFINSKFMTIIWWLNPRCYAKCIVSAATMNFERSGNLSIFPTQPKLLFLPSPYGPGLVMYLQDLWRSTHRSTSELLLLGYRYARQTSVISVHPLCNCE